MSTDIYIPTVAEPVNPDGSTFTTFLNDARVITPSLFANATSKTCTVETVPADPDTGTPEMYHVHFDQDLTPDERTLVLLIMQSDANMDAVIAAAKKALTDNSTWNANTLPQIVNGANAIINATGTAAYLPNDKQLAQAVKTLANQVADLDNQNRALIKWALGLRETAL
jgi:hypothetical protein